MKLKRGDTLAFYANFKDAEGKAVAYDNIHSQIRRTNGLLLANLTITPTETVGRYLFNAGATDTFPLGVHECDIQVKVNEKIVSTDTFNIEIIRDITKEE